MTDTPDPTDTTIDTLDRLNPKLLTEHLHTKFKVHLETPEDLELELTEVVEHNPSPRVECFSVFFRGPRSPQLQQATQTLEHRALGTIGLFLTPVAMDQTGLTYEAVFNRFRKIVSATIASASRIQNDD